MLPSVTITISAILSIFTDFLTQNPKFLDHVSYQDRHIFTQIFYDQVETFGIGQLTDPRLRRAP